MSSHFTQLYEFGPFRLDVAERIVLRNQEPVPLSPKAFETLLALARKSGRLVCKDELMREVWPGGTVEDSNVSHSIYLLRKALGRDADGKLYIETVSKHGYRLVANVRESPVAESTEPLLHERARARLLVAEDEREVKQAESPRAQVATRALMPAAAPARSSTRRRGTVPVFSCGLLICVALVSSWWMEKREAARSTHTRSIAVLPFKPINAASSDDHLGLGMTGATINRLGAQRQFSVQPASAVFKYTDRADDSLTIGRGLGVDAVLEGTVQRSGDDVRVTVQLINVSDGQTLWSQKFDARFTTMHAVQDEISEQVADSLQLELTSRDKKQLARSDTENPQGKL